jgi:hypothetical protein
MSPDHFAVHADLFNKFAIHSAAGTGQLALIAHGLAVPGLSLYPTWADKRNFDLNARDCVSAKVLSKENVDWLREVRPDMHACT